MLTYLRSLLLATRRWPVYTGLVLVGTWVFLLLGLRGHRILGDDSDAPDTELRGAPRAGGHGGYVHGFNHK